MKQKVLGALLIQLLLGAASVDAQPKTRAEEIDIARREKIARLWPERESPMVDMVNGFVERGLLDDSEGAGANGFQVVLGGMRSGQGASFGIGYRRSDIWNDQLAYRFTARGTLQNAWMLDAELDFPKLRSERGYITLYSKFESSPQMDYYGEGINSSQDDRTSYSWDTLSFDGSAAYELFNNFRVGISGGILDAATGTGRTKPSTEEVFNPPGLGENTWYLNFAGFVLYDYRDHPGGPRRVPLSGIAEDVVNELHELAKVAESGIVCRDGSRVLLERIVGVELLCGRGRCQDNQQEGTRCDGPNPWNTEAESSLTHITSSYCPKGLILKMSLNVHMKRAPSFP